MSAEQFDNEISEATDLFLAETAKINTAWRGRIEAIMADQKHKDVPDHLVAASLKKALARVNAAAEALERGDDA